MYFDDENEAVIYIEKVSIPLEQGNVFRQNNSEKIEKV